MCPRDGRRHNSLHAANHTRALHVAKRTASAAPQPEQPAALMIAPRATPLKSSRAQNPRFGSWPTTAKPANGYALSRAPRRLENIRPRGSQPLHPADDDLGGPTSTENEPPTPPAQRSPLDSAAVGRSRTSMLDAGPRDSIHVAAGRDLTSAQTRMRSRRGERRHRFKATNSMTPASLRRRVLWCPRRSRRT